MRIFFCRSLLPVMKCICKKRDIPRNDLNDDKSKCNGQAGLEQLQSLLQGKGIVCLYKSVHHVKKRSSGDNGHNGSGKEDGGGSPVDSGHHISISSHKDSSGKSGGKIICCCLVHKGVAGAVDEPADAGPGGLSESGFEKQGKPHACKAAGDQLYGHVGGYVHFIHGALHKDHRQPDAAGDGDSPQEGVGNVQDAGNDVMVQHITDPVCGAQAADQYHGYAQDNTVRMVAETKPRDQEDGYCR